MQDHPGRVTVESNYVPSEKGALFHSSSAKYKILVGGLGSGKSRMAVEEIIQLMMENPEIEIFVMRKTMPALRDSTLNEFLKQIPEELGHYNKRTETFYGVNASKLMFRGLDEPTKIKSTNPAVIVLDEADEFTFEDFQTLKGRVRQMREQHDSRPAFPLHFILILNPVDESHWIYKQFVENKKEYEGEGLLVLKIPTYDNLQNLPAGYIEQVTAGMTPDEKKRFIDGEWGTITKGKPVYGDVFRADLHLKKWEFHAGLIICRGWDFGFNHPAVSIRLKDQLGRKNIDFEMLGDHEHLEVFARRVMSLCESRYGKTVKIFDYCDPRGFDQSDKGQSSVDVLNTLGIYPIGERGVRAYVEPGVQVIRKELSTLISGEPELTINPECAIIRAAYAGRYVRDDDGFPKKEGYYEHICDADRYIAYNDRTNSAVKDAIISRTAKTRSRVTNRYTGY